MFEFKNEILRLELEGTNIETIELEGLVVARKPIITDQPVGGMINDEQTIMLSVVADGLGSTMTYQWYKSDGTAISGATGDSYEFTPLTTGSYSFYCRVDGFGGYTQTNTAVVNVESAIKAPVITKEIANGEIDESGSYTASITVNWNGEVGSIVWYLDGVAQPSSDDTVFVFSDVSVGKHKIKATATNSKGSDTSEADLIVNAVLSILTIGDAGTSAPTMRGKNGDLYGELTNPEYTIRPDGELVYIIARDGLLEGASGGQVFDFSFTTSVGDYTNISVQLGGIDVELDINDFTVIPHPSYGYIYAVLLVNTTVTGNYLTLWNEIWNNVGSEYEFRIKLS